MYLWVFAISSCNVTTPEVTADLWDPAELDSWLQYMVIHVIICYYSRMPSDWDISGTTAGVLEVRAFSRELAPAVYSTAVLRASGPG